MTYYMKGGQFLSLKMQGGGAYMQGREYRIFFLSLRMQGGWGGGGGVKGWVGRPGSIKLSLRMQGG